MFIPTEGEDCIFLYDAVALIHEEKNTVVYYADGRTGTTGFRPVTLKRRYKELMKEAVHPRLPASQEEND